MHRPAFQWQCDKWLFASQENSRLGGIALWFALIFSSNSPSADSLYVCVLPIPPAEHKRFSLCPELEAAWSG